MWKVGSHEPEVEESEIIRLNVVRLVRNSKLPLGRTSYTHFKVPKRAQFEGESSFYLLEFFDCMSIGVRYI